MTGRPKQGLDPQDCPSCGSRFTPYRATQRACSRKCRDALGPVPEDARPFVIEFTCKRCGQQGTARTTTQGGRRDFCDSCRPAATVERITRKNTARSVRFAIDPERARLRNRRSAVAKYGLTVDEYDAMLAAQGGACLLCSKPPAGPGHGASSRLHVDHDHASGKVRGLLCNTCNQGIGYLMDDPDLMLKAAQYVKRHRT